MIETLNKLGIEENPQFEKGNKNLQITLCLKINFFLLRSGTGKDFSTLTNPIHYTVTPRNCLQK